MGGCITVSLPSLGGVITYISSSSSASSPASCHSEGSENSFQSSSSPVPQSPSSSSSEGSCYSRTREDSVGARKSNQLDDHKKNQSHFTGLTKSHGTLKSEYVFCDSLPFTLAQFRYSVSPLLYA